MRSAVFRIAAALSLFMIFAAAQSHFPTPPEPMDPDAQKTDQAKGPPRHIDFVRVQKEADDLARTAQTIPADVSSIQKGMVPKDVMEKLKEIEKLSKRLRTELNP
jgi:hypothetical protein